MLKDAWLSKTSSDVGCCPVDLPDFLSELASIISVKCRTAKNKCSAMLLSYSKHTTVPQLLKVLEATLTKKDYEYFTPAKVEKVIGVVKIRKDGIYVNAVWFGSNDVGRWDKEEDVLEDDGEAKLLIDKFTNDNLASRQGQSTYSNATDASSTMEIPFAEQLGFQNHERVLYWILQDLMSPAYSRLVNTRQVAAALSVLAKPEPSLYDYIYSSSTQDEASASAILSQAILKSKKAEMPVWEKINPVIDSVMVLFGKMQLRLQKYKTNVQSKYVWDLAQSTPMINQGNAIDDSKDPDLAFDSKDQAATDPQLEEAPNKSSLEVKVSTVGQHTNTHTTNTYTHTHIHTHTHTHTHTHIHTHTHTHTHTHAYTHTHIHTHTHALSHTHTHI
jgi:hypothetical protein